MKKMSNLNKFIFRIIFVASFLCIAFNLNTFVDMFGNRSYEDIDWEDIDGTWASAEFTQITYTGETLSGAKFTYDAVLTNGEHVVCEAYRNLIQPQVGVRLKGEFEQKDDALVFSYYPIGYGGIDSIHYVVLMFGCIGFLGCIIFKIARKTGFLETIKNDWEAFLSTAVKERESGFEILRILCILMVIMQHFAYWGDFTITSDVDMNTVILQFIVNFGKIGVNCFMMITGFFMVYSRFDWKKVVKLMMTVWFYSWGFGLIWCFADYRILDIECFFKTTFPILTGQYWFITIYIIVYALSPFLNAAATGVSKKEFKAILIFLYVIWSVIPMTGYAGWNFTNTGWMILMYLTGAYIRLHVEKNKEKKSWWLLGFAASYMLLTFVTVLYDKYVEANVYQQAIAQKDDILIIVAGVCIFMFFYNIQIKYNKIINLLASCSFGIYLIHENVIIKQFLWTDWIKNNQYFGEKYFGIYAIGVIAAVYFACAAIELIRKAFVTGIKIIAVKGACYAKEK